MDDIIVTDQGIVKLLLKLNPSKACSPDLLLARILKELAHDHLTLPSLSRRVLIPGEYPRTGEVPMLQSY